MERHTIKPRDNFLERIEGSGLVWSDDYWDDTAYYSFNSNQIAEIEKATEECHQMFIEAGDFVINNDLFDDFGIPEHAREMIVETWNNEPPCLNYGRFDFGYDGVNPPKLFEYNCDTPTSLLEASVIQWDWKTDVFPNLDQFNNIDAKLISRYNSLGVKEIHFGYVNDEVGEDPVTVAYHMDCAQRAGIKPIMLDMNDVGYTNEFVDADENPIQNFFHLYPWEWMITEEFGVQIPYSDILWLEPAWKMMWSNKAILPILYKLYPDSPYLLKSSFDNDVGSNYVKKPILAREGANITIHTDKIKDLYSEGRYNTETCIYQEFYSLPEFEGKYPVIGSWCMDGYAVGMGIREDGLITGNKAKFRPHVIRD